MIKNYIKIAWKVLLRHPFYTFITLFGISMTLTILMVLTSFLDHFIGPHYPEGKRDRSLYILNMTLEGADHGSGTNSSSSAVSYNFLKTYVKTLKIPENLGISTVSYNTVSIYANGKKIKATPKYTDAGFWEVTDFTFLEGKPFNQINIDKGDHVAVITEEFREGHFGEKAATAVGREIKIDNTTYRVTGVVKGSPPSRPYTYADIYLPYTDPKSGYRSEGLSGMYAAIILAQDKGDIPRIQQEFDQAVSRIPRPVISRGDKFDMIGVKADTYLDSFLIVFFSDSRLGKPVFFTVIVLIMLMLMGLPVINLVNVNISRILERSSEIGIRKSFGAPSRTLLWQFITENIFITFLGCGIALILTSIIIYLINTSGVIPYADLTINLNVFAVSVLICFVFGFLSGVLPALRMSRMRIVDALKG